MLPIHKSLQTNNANLFQYYSKILIRIIRKSILSKPSKNIEINYWYTVVNVK